MSVQGYRIILFCYERIVGAAPAFVILTEDAFGHEVVDIVQRCVRGKFPDLGPLAGGRWGERRDGHASRARWSPDRELKKVP